MAEKNPSWVTAGEIRLFLLIALGLSILAGGVTALATVMSKPPEKTNKLPAINPFKPNKDDTIPQVISTSDLLYPGPPGALGSRDWSYFRPPHTSWTEEEIKPYWSDSGDTQTAKLSGINDQHVLKLLEAAP